MPLDFWAVKAGWHGDMASLVHALWEEADKGAISADSFEPWRLRALERPLPEPSSAAGARLGGLAAGSRGRLPAALRARWKAGPPLAGHWFSLELDGFDSDEADELDLASVRVRVLARRYGVLSRALLERELPCCRWQALFPALRRLELAGELVAGRFFEELEGLQFLSQEALARFSSGEAAVGIWSLSAQDPASPAGLYAPGCLPSAYEGLPARSRRNHVAFKDGVVAWSAQAGFRELRVAVSPDDPALAALFGRIATFKPSVPGSPSLIIRRINGLTAADSPYAAALEALGFERDRGSLRLW
jgi:ATP-dependent Lhr-like helicase